jgi:hypothetical protein
LVDHYSAPRHRAALKRHDANMRAGVEAEQRARELEQRATAVGTGGISSDDPDALSKLCDKRAGLMLEQDRGKAVNAAYRKRDSATLVALSGRDLASWDSEMEKRYSWDKQPVPSYVLANRNKEIARLGKRIAEIHAAAERLAAADASGAGDPSETFTTSAGAVVTVTDDLADNRVRITFPRELEQIRSAIKARGWIWSPTRQAYVRKSGRNVYALACMIVRDAVTRET